MYFTQLNKFFKLALIFIKINVFTIVIFFVNTTV